MAKEHNEEFNEETEAKEKAIMPDEVLADAPEIGEADKQAAQIRMYIDKIQRQAAEFENYRARTTREMAQIFDNGAKEVLLALLPIVDNFDRALAAENDGANFTKGVQMIRTQLASAMDNLGLTPIPAVGQKFDTKLHAAVTHIDDPELGENEIAAELAAGYMFKGKVLRHSMVTVAN